MDNLPSFNPDWFLLVIAIGLIEGAVQHYWPQRYYLYGLTIRRQLIFTVKSVQLSHLLEHSTDLLNVDDTYHFVVIPLNHYEVGLFLTNRRERWQRRYRALFHSRLSYEPANHSLTLYVYLNWTLIPFVPLIFSAISDSPQENFQGLIFIAAVGVISVLAVLEWNRYNILIEKLQNWR